MRTARPAHRDATPSPATTCVSFPNSPDIPRAHRVLHGAHCRWKSGQGVTLSTHLYPVPKLRTRGAIPPTATCLHIDKHTFALRVIKFRRRDPLLWSFEAVGSSLPASDAASLVEWLQTFRRNVVCLPSRVKQSKEDPWKWTHCDLSKRQKPLAQWHGWHIVAELNLTKRRCVSHCWTWFILTLHESAGARERKTLLTRCGSFKPRISINTIFTLLIQMEHWRNKQLGDSKENKATVTSTPLSSLRNVYFRTKYDQMSGNIRTC